MLPSLRHAAASPRPDEMCLAYTWCVYSETTLSPENERGKFIKSHATDGPRQKE